MFVGIIGKANVGKSTLYKAITLADVLIANYPFATIDPNKGAGCVRIDCVDTEFGVQCNPRTGFCVNHQRFVPVDVMDVAGLVPGAHLGKGLGLSFLDDLRQADVLVHVVDMAGTTNERGEPCDAGSYDPANDVRFLEHELDMWVLGILKKGWERFARQLQQEHGDVASAIGKQLSGLNITEVQVKNAMQSLKIDVIPPLHWSEEQLLQLAIVVRKTKPLIVAANKMDIPVAEVNLERIKKEFSGLMIVPCSGDAELTLKQAARANLIQYVQGDGTFTITGNVSEKQRAALDFIQKSVLDKFGSTGVQKVLNAAVFDLLKYVAIFPGGMSKLADQFGRILPDCFLLPPNSTAFDFAGRIHTDLQKNFIAAIDVKTRRKVGREHVLKHRDVVEIMTK